MAAKFIKLTGEYGEDLYINVLHIHKYQKSYKQIYPNDLYEKIEKECSVIYYNIPNSYTDIVKETVDQITEKLKGLDNGI